jgi:hypothetical protein|tara:strand:- start:6769 stop:6894 length:126 start_codon:yes stop_codon:yes gene_type:complete
MWAFYCKDNNYGGYAVALSKEKRKIKLMINKMKNRAQNKIM